MVTNHPKTVIITGLVFTQKVCQKIIIKPQGRNNNYHRIKQVDFLRVSCAKLFQTTFS